VKVTVVPLATVRVDGLKVFAVVAITSLAAGAVGVDGVPGVLGAVGEPSPPPPPHAASATTIVATIHFRTDTDMGPPGGMRRYLNAEILLY